MKKMKKKILVADGVSELGIDILQEEFEVVERPQLDKEELLATIGEYDAIVLRSATKMTAEVIAKADRLQVIGRAGVGVDNIDIEAATAKGIIVLNAPDGNTNAATEHTFALMLALARQIPQAHASMAAGRWDRKAFLGVELRNRTLGILGLGRIGAGVALRAQAFGMQIVAYDPFLTAERAETLGVRKATLEEVLQAADFLTLHLPLTDETRNLINRERLALMKDGARIINAARGGCVVISDLVDALRSGKLAGAALDVYPEEPLTDADELLALPNVVLTPHLGASTVEAQEGVAVDVAHGIVAALHGEPVAAALNMAPVAPELLALLQPFFPLATAVGNIAVELAEGPIEEVTIEYAGALVELDTRALTTTVLQGLLNPILQEAVNHVNAPALAKARGIVIKEMNNLNEGDYTDTLTLQVRTAAGTQRIVGALLDGRPYVVAIDDYEIRFAPEGPLVLVPHADRPGMIGKIGTLLGENGINIRGMQVANTARAGHNIMAIAVDRMPAEDLVAALRDIDGVDAVSTVYFRGM